MEENELEVFNNNYDMIRSYNPSINQSSLSDLDLLTIKSSNEGSRYESQDIKMIHSGF
jgi:hypothetical protein